MVQTVIRRWPLMCVLAGCLTNSSSFAAPQTESASPPIPTPGRLVDIGGWRLHLYCSGQASSSQPTVILEAGTGDFSAEWSIVQPKLAAFVRVCSYDRAGTGWSELGPHPRTMHQIVYELHVLLERAGVRPPYLLVGHSYGAWLVRLYASKYRSDIAGMVLVEGGFDNPWRMVNGKLARAEKLAADKPIPPVKTTVPLTESDIPADALKQMKEAAAGLVRGANDPPRNKLPADAQRMRTWVLSRWQHVAAHVNPFELEEIASLRAERAKSEYPLGDMPLAVITRGIPDEDGPGGKQAELERRKAEHAELAKTLSRNGRQIIAERSGHHVQIEEPDVVVTAVRDVITESRK
jgi:pimeloyl-ACP methyl ester carboxylesterase